jgi:hypothetical protein
VSASADDLVSVVIASYNMGHYLVHAVRSVLSQSYSNVEVQIVDDGSTDDTAKLVRQWQSDPRVRVHSQPNAGQARAKNTGVSLSRGRFVALTPMTCGYRENWRVRWSCSGVALKWAWCTPITSAWTGREGRSPRA